MRITTLIFHGPSYRRPETPPSPKQRLMIPHLVPHETVHQLRFLVWQCVVAPCHDFGLVDRREGASLAEPDQVRITPLFGEFISFRFDRN